MNDKASTAAQPAASWRLKIGVALFVLSIAFPLVGAEVLGIIAIAVMGKSGYAYIKNRVVGFLKQYGPPREVSRLRYTIGLVMFSLPILFGWVSLYTAELIPGFIRTPLPYALGGDLLLLASLFVLGGNFWDKIRALFVYDAEVRFPQR